MRQPRMRFLYKIWSGYDGFTPRRIAERRDEKNRLVLGWTSYIDVIETGAEVWVYFHGPHAFRRGVYVKGFVDAIDLSRQRVYLRVREHSTSQPLTDDTTNAQVAEAVSQRYRQVFFLPETLLPPVPDCTLENCSARHCDGCSRWRSIPLIDPADLGRPRRLPYSVDAFIPAYWVIPTRCFLWYEGVSVARTIQAGSDMFYRFKAGEERLAYPLARGIYEVLCHHERFDFDCVIPIPLSPDKLEAGELNRALALAREVGRLLGVLTLELFALRAPISKRRLRNVGVSIGEFERQYKDLLVLDSRLSQFTRVLLVDDVCDHGSTLRCAVERVLAVRPDTEIVVATAGQMIVKEAVRDATRLAA